MAIARIGVAERARGGDLRLAATNPRGLPPPERNELRRPLAMQHRTDNRRVGELDAVARLPEQQSAAAHVATADELDRKPEAPAEDADQHVDVLGRGYAAEEDDGA